MKIGELIKARRTVQVFNAKVVPDSLVSEALNLALWAPNHKLTFPWRFVNVGPAVREQLAKLSVELKERKKGPLSEIQRQALHRSFLLPSHLIVLAMKKSADPGRQSEDYAAVAAGVQNAQLFLWNEGVGTKWGTGVVTTHPTTYNLCGLNPETEETVGFLWIGHFDQPPQVTSRPQLNEVLTKTN